MVHITHFQPSIHGTTMKPESQNDSDFFRVATVSICLSFGVMIASLQALQPSTAGFSFKITGGTWVAFVLGAVLSYGYWRLASQPATTPGRRLFRRICTWLLMLSGVGALLYPLRFLPAERLPDVAIGFTCAVVVLSFVGYLMWRLKKFFDQDEEQSNSQDNHSEHADH